MLGVGCPGLVARETTGNWCHHDLWSLKILTARETISSKSYRTRLQFFFFGRDSATWPSVRESHAPGSFGGFHACQYQNLQALYQRKLALFLKIGCLHPETCSGFCLSFCSADLLSIIQGTTHKLKSLTVGSKEGTAITSGMQCLGRLCSVNLGPKNKSPCGLSQTF
jgi:hypothetical protein